MAPGTRSTSSNNGVFGSIAEWPRVPRAAMGKTYRTQSTVLDHWPDSRREEGKTADAAGERSGSPDRITEA